MIMISTLIAWFALTLTFPNGANAGWEAYDADGDYVGSVDHVFADNIDVTVNYAGKISRWTVDPVTRLWKPGYTALFLSPDCTGTPYVSDALLSAR